MKVTIYAEDCRIISPAIEVVGDKNEPVDEVIKAYLEAASKLMEETKI